MELFYRLNPTRMIRYQPYMLEWLKVRHYDRSEQGWIDGIYIRDAVACTLVKKAKYPDEPIHFYSTKQEVEAAEEEAAMVDVERFKAFATAFNKQYELSHTDSDVTSEGDTVPDSGSNSGTTKEE